jgi:uncharacterized protein
MKLKSLLFASLIVASISAAQTTVSIAPDAASKEDVQRLFDAMASRDQMAQMMQQLFAQMRSLTREQIKKQHPDVTDAELARIDRQSESLMKNFPMDAMLSEMVPIYQKHFTKSDIDALVAFYGSPTGQKFLREMPAVTAETMRAVYPKLQAQMEGATKAADKNDSTEK